MYVENLQPNHGINLVHFRLKSFDLLVHNISLKILSMNSPRILKAINSFKCPVVGIIFMLYMFVML